MVRVAARTRLAGAHRATAPARVRRAASDLDTGGGPATTGQAVAGRRRRRRAPESCPARGYTPRRLQACRVLPGRPARTGEPIGGRGSGLRWGESSAVSCRTFVAPLFRREPVS